MTSARRFRPEGRTGLWIDHFGVDFQFLLLAIAALLFGRTIIYFKVWTLHRRMPLLLVSFLVALFIWLAENIATAGGAWLYPNHWAGIAVAILMRGLLVSRPLLQGASQDAAPT